MERYVHGLELLHGVRPVADAYQGANDKKAPTTRLRTARLNKLTVVIFPFLSDRAVSAAKDLQKLVCCQLLRNRTKLYQKCTIVCTLPFPSANVQQNFQLVSKIT